MLRACFNLYENFLMKPLIRLFFKIVRLVVGPILLFTDWLTTPRGVVRSTEAQLAVDAATHGFVLYQFKTCPFCMKVRRTCKRLSLKIETRDAQHNPDVREELLQATGKVQVPCLKITAADGGITWLLESDAIIEYLQSRFAA
jgi:glutaredoxin